MYLLKVLKLKTYFCRKCVALHTVFRPKLIVKAIVDVNLIESIQVRKGPTAEIDGNLRSLVGRCRFIVDGENDTMSCVCNCAAYLVERLLPHVITTTKSAKILRGALGGGGMSATGVGMNFPINRCGGCMRQNQPDIHNYHLPYAYRYVKAVDLGRIADAVALN